MELEGSETEALWKLSSAHEACTLSACAPVVVPSSFSLDNVVVPSIFSLDERVFPESIEPRRVNVFSHIYYDCTDPEEGGLMIMGYRIRRESDNIRTHLKIHESLLENFCSVDDALKAGDREKLVESGKRVFEDLEECGKLVDEHSARLKGSAFLYYPTCIPGHVFAPAGTGILKEKVFNPEQNANGLRSEIINGLRTLENFPLNGRLEEIDIYSEIDSLEQNMKTTKMLLERAGFEFE